MFLAHCIAVCEDDLICDFAEYYRIYDYRALPAGYAATLCAGLREPSRVMMRLAGSKISLRDSLFARMVDELAFIGWTKTKDGQKNRNRPKSVYAALTTEKVKELESFTTEDDFRAEWDRIIRSATNAE